MSETAEDFAAQLTHLLSLSRRNFLLPPRAEQSESPSEREREKSVGLSTAKSKVRTQKMLLSEKQTFYSLTVIRNCHTNCGNNVHTLCLVNT